MVPRYYAAEQVPREFRQIPISYFLLQWQKQLLQKTEEELSWEYMSSTTTESRLSPTQPTVVLHE